MSHSLQAGHSLVVSAFHTDLVQQLLGVLLVLVALVVVRNFIRTTKYSRAGAAADSVQGLLSPEPVARRVLRIGFGLLWLFNGLLQIQASMPLGMAPGVLRPAASSSPSWVQHVVNVAVTIWANHPVTVATAIVWIEVGIGLLLLVAPRGGWSQASGVVSVGWGLIVWVFGEAFGGLFAPGLTWAFGAPGAALIYVVAGGLIALPERWWRTPKLGERIVSIVGAFFVVMAVLQAWPGRGFWQGNSHGSDLGRHLGIDDQGDGEDPSAGVSVVLGLRVRILRRHPRLGGQPLLGGRPGRYWHRTAVPAPEPRSLGCDRSRPRLPGRLGPCPGSRLPGWRRHRRQLDDPHDAGIRRRVSGHRSPAGDGQGGHR